MADGPSYGYLPYYIIIAGLIIGIMAFVLVGITQNYIAAFTAHDEDVPRHIYAFRTINTCLAYQDDVTKRFYPGVIDIEKFKQKNLDNCFFNTTAVFSVQLEDSEKQKSHGRLMTGFGAYRVTREYPIWIRYSDGIYSKGEILFSMR